MNSGFYTASMPGWYLHPKLNLDIAFFNEVLILELGKRDEQLSRISLFWIDDAAVQKCKAPRIEGILYIIIYCRT